MFGTITSQPTTSAPFGAATTAPLTEGISAASGTTQSQKSGISLSTAIQPVTGGLFGSKPETTQGQTGIFGSTQSTSGGLFGQTTIANSNSQPNGLFSSVAQNSTINSGFGNTATSKSTQITGSFPALTQHSTSGSVGLLGQTNQNQSTFGSFANQSKSPTNQPLSQQQQTVPGVLIDASNIRGTTRFNDLKEELQKQLIEIDTMIQSQIQLKNDCDAIMPAHDSQLTQIPVDVEFCQRKLIGVDNAADSDIHAISAVQKLIKSDAEAAKLSFAAIDMLRLPPQYHMPGILPPETNSRGNDELENIVGFFSQTADELSAKLTTYQRHLSEIEQHLRGVEINSAHQINNLVANKSGNSLPEESSFDQLAGVLRDFETGLLKIAGKVGEARKGVTALQLNQFPSMTRSRI